MSDQSSILTEIHIEYIILINKNNRPTLKYFPLYITNFKKEVTVQYIFTV